MLTRRDTLLMGAAALVAPRPGFAQSAMPELVAQPAAVQLAPENYAATDLWTFGGQIPGTEIRLKQGARFERKLINKLPAETTVHWHGLRVPNDMDGVPGFSQAPVAAGGTFDYSFDLPDAGTYWYHPHMGAPEQVARGLAGAFIVEERDPPDVDGEHVLVIDDWRLTEDAQLSEEFDNGHDLSHAGRIGNFVTVNGQDKMTLNARSGDRMRLRLINAATARVFTLELQGLTGWIIALDGMPVAAPFRAKKFPLGPAQRVDLLVDVTAQPGEEAFLVSQERGTGYAVVTLPVSAGGSRKARGAPAPLPPNTVPGPDLAQARTVPLSMTGGAMAWLESAQHNGKILDGRGLAAQGQFWAFNGVAGMPPDPLVTAGLGESIRLAMVNDTRFAHVIHLHGHHVSILNADGTAGPLRDSILLAPGQSREIAFVADNPGDWMVHCHMLSHQISGMMSWIRVA